MTLNEFIRKYRGVGIDYDKAYSFQCVDLYRQYCHEVLNIEQSPGVRGAADIWDTYLKEHFNRIKNTPDGIPQPGDIIIWNRKMGGGFGHVAINVNAKIDQLEVFEQDGIIQSKARVEIRKYTHILGWLRFKDDIITPDMNEDTQRALKLLGDFKNKEGLGNMEGTVNAVLGAFKDFKTLKIDHDNYKRDKQEEIEKINIELLNANSQIGDLELKIEKLREGGDDNMATKKVDYPIVKKAFWDGWRVFVPVFLTTLGAQFQMGVNMDDWLTWLRSVVAAALVAGVKAVVKWARETYAKGEYQSLLYKLPT